MTRKQAIAAGKSTYWTGKPCKNGHVDWRYVLNWTCVTCHAKKSAEYQPKWRAKNPDKQAEYHKKYSAKHAESNKRWRESNKEHCLQTQRDWNRRNTERRNELSRLWRSKNAFVMRAHRVKRQVALWQRMPAWMNEGHLLEMRSVYAYCLALRHVGLDYHVDHMVPLRGKSVSGLHVPWNLQVISAKENLSKGNRFNG